MITLEDVLFEVNGADLQPGTQVQLLRLVEFLKGNPDRKVLIEGHTDSIGRSEYNLQLSLLRAESVQSFLVGNGLPADRVTPRPGSARSAKRQRYWPSTKSPGRGRHTGCG